ncbi:hypothetical protein MIR68_006137 [Amoeboaphelidium protococcarum]|nr:hypothetical protein MIR68_006137 [Amoeboaphelidium protococcarum]
MEYQKVQPSSEQNSVSNCYQSDNDERSRCWACWESDNGPDCRDPLVKVCTGCKDPDLQYIHQNCIDLYVTNIIKDSAAQAGFPMLIYDVFSSRNILDCQVADFVSFRQQQQNKTQITRDDGDIYNGARMTQLGQSTSTIQNILKDIQRLFYPHTYVLDSLLKCTRCMQNYKIHLSPMRPLKALRADKSMLWLVSILSISVAVLFVACLSMIVSSHMDALAMARMNPTTNYVIVMNTYIFKEPVEIRSFALWMMGIFGAFYTLTISAIMYHLTGYVQVTVQSCNK